MPEGTEKVSFKGKKNIYTCNTCYRTIITVDKDEGTTPFMIACKVSEGCTGMMRSSLYRVFDQTMKPSHEWYTPSEQELIGKTEQVKDHVQRGGLLLREVKHGK